jgi:hypothetical protein
VTIEAPGEGGTSAGNETANRPVCCLIPSALIASVRWLKGIPSTPRSPFGIAEMVQAWSLALALASLRKGPAPGAQ